MIKDRTTVFILFVIASLLINFTLQYVYVVLIAKEAFQFSFYYHVLSPITMASAVSISVFRQEIASSRDKFPSVRPPRK